MNRHLHDKAFIGLLVVVTVAFGWLLVPFYGAVFWAVILAIIFHPLQRELVRRFDGNRTLAAFASVLVCILIAVLPLLAIVSALISEVSDLVARLRSRETGLPANLDDIYAVLPGWLVAWLDRAELGNPEALRDRFVGLLGSLGQALASRAVTVGQDALRFLASIGIMLYVLFFLFRDGPSIGRNLREALPISPAYSRRLIGVFAAVVRATVKGNLVIAMIQGGIGGLAFWFLGIEAALLWGVLMTFLSILPAVGAGLVWAPMAAFLFVAGEPVKGAILVGLGVGVISVVDNLLRPPLVGADTRLPDYVVLVSTIGGMSLFGINGFVIGPLVAALFIAAWSVFREDWVEGPAPGPGEDPEGKAPVQAMPRGTDL